MFHSNLNGNNLDHILKSLTYVKKKIYFIQKEILKIGPDPSKVEQERKESLINQKVRYKNLKDILHQKLKHQLRREGQAIDMKQKFTEFGDLDIMEQLEETSKEV